MTNGSHLLMQPMGNNEGTSSERILQAMGKISSEERQKGLRNYFRCLALRDW